MKQNNLPTELGMQLLGDVVVGHLKDRHTVKEAVCYFQRMALVADVETSIKSMSVWFKDGFLGFDESQMEMVNMAHETVKKDVLGMTVEAMIDICSKSTTDQQRLAAATMINELYGEKKLTESTGLAERLLVNITRDLTGSE